MADEKSKDKKDRLKTDDGTLVVETVGRDFRVEGNDVSGYIGVDPEYRTYANETDRPYVTDEDVAVLEASGQPTDVELLTLTYGGAPKDEGVDKEESEEVDSKSGSEADAKPSATKPSAPAPTRAAQAKAEDSNK